MYCTNCGTEINDRQKFCSNCGVRLQSPKGEVQQKTLSKTFAAAGLLIPDPASLVNSMNNWFNSVPVSFVRMNLQIYRGVVRQITITYNESSQPVTFIFRIDMIKFGFFDMFKNPSADQYINEWIKNHQHAQIVTQRVVTYNSVPSQIWILYKTAKNSTL